MPAPADGGPPPAATFAEVISRRRMVRRYRSDPVDRSALLRILDAARRGPSAGFSQPQRFVVITGPQARARVAAACGEAEHVARGLRPWLSVAPVLIVPCVRRESYVERYAAADKEASVGPDGWQVPFWWVDGGAALMLLLLATVAEGLAAGFLDVDPDRLQAAISIPAGWWPLGLVTIGHPEPDGRPGSQNRPRLDLEEVLCWVQD